MSLLDDAVVAIVDRIPFHFGQGIRSQSLRQQIDVALGGVRETIGLELEELRALQRLGRVATIVGLMLLLIAVILFMAEYIRLGAVTALVGVVVQVLTALIFVRIEKTRVALGKVLPDQKFLFGVALLLEEGEKSQEVTDRVIATIDAKVRRGGRGSG